MRIIKTDYYRLYNGSCLDVMPQLKKHSISLILTDPPYGTTSAKWDRILPFNKMWKCIKYVLKPFHACVLFGAEPFTCQLKCSNLEWFKYDWIWVKNKPVGFVNAKNKPMNKHEVISVFSEGTNANCAEHNTPYYPQGLITFGKKVKSINGVKGRENTYWRPSTYKKFLNGGYVQEYTNYPDTVLFYNQPESTEHSTQKPIELLKYLIRTYTKENEIVLDFTMGSGSTGVACMLTNRRFIGIELTKNYFEVAKKRIEKATDSLIFASYHT